MSPAMACKLVTLADYAPYHRRVTLCEPSQSKKRRLCSLIVQEGEDTVDIGLHPARDGCPGLPRDVISIRRNLEVILHVYGHCVTYRSGFHFKIQLKLMRWRSEALTKP